MRSLREKMPLCAAFIDEMREAFGEKVINENIKLGIAGLTTFYAEENGITVGTKDTRVGCPLSKMVWTPPAAIVQALKQKKPGI